MDYATVAELRKLPGLSDSARFTGARLTAAGEWLEGIIERELNTSFVYREHTSTVSGNNQDSRGRLTLPRRYVREILGVTSNGVDFTETQLAAVEVVGGRRVAQRAGPSTFTAWELGDSNLTFRYVDGYTSRPPADVKQTFLQGARYRAITQARTEGISDRATSITNEFGNVNLSTPDRDHPTGIPDVDAMIAGWRRRLTATRVAVG